MSKLAKPPPHLTASPVYLAARLTTVVFVQGVRLGLVRRTRFAATCDEAVAKVFTDLPPRTDKRLFSVDAGMASAEQFQQATEKGGLVGGVRRDVSLRRAPHPRRPGRRGRPPLPGAVLPPGAKRPQGRAAEDTIIQVEDREVRVRRWKTPHFARAHQAVIDVVRVDDPNYKRRVLIGTPARELTSAEIREAYGHGWRVETNYYVAQARCATDRPRAASEQAVARRTGLALLGGALRKAIAAACEPLRRGPWDRQAVGSAGRLANHLGYWSTGFRGACPDGGGRERVS